MAHKVMYKKDAEKFLTENGWKIFLNMIVRDRVVVLPDIEVEAIFVTEKFAKEHGTIRLELWLEGLVLWVGGQIVWKQWENKWMKKN